MVYKTVRLNEDGSLRDGTLQEILESIRQMNAFVDEEPGYDIVLLIGQSNISGRGTPTSIKTDPLNDRIFQWGTHGVLGIKPALEPLDMHDTANGIGPGLQFARWYAMRRLKPGRKVLLVPAAHGGTRLVSNAVLAWRRGVAGNLYDNAIAQTLAAVSAAGSGSRVVATIFGQGESDGDANVTGTDYQADLDPLINGVRTDLGVPGMPFIIQTMVPEYLSTGTRAQINAVQRETPLRIERVDIALGASASNLADGNHFNAAGQRINGLRVFEAFERIMEGLSPYFEEFRPNAVATITAVGTSTTSITVSWAASTRATSYLVEYRASGSAGAWTNAGSVTTLSKVLTGLTLGTVYEIRVTAQNLGASAAASPIVTASPAEPPLVLGVPAFPLLARSAARRVVSTYTGPLVRVRRTSDNVEQDIGMTGTFVLDTAALTTFLGSSDGKVVTLYDQSGGAHHLTQSTPGAQPALAAAGAVILSGGKPAISSDGVDDCLVSTTPVVYANGFTTMLAVIRGSNGNQVQSRWWTESRVATSAEQYGLAQPDSGAAPAYPLITGVLGLGLAPAPTKVVFNDAIHQVSANDSGTTMSQWVDGVADISNVGYTRPALTKDRETLFGVTRAGSLAPTQGFFFSEQVFFATPLSTTDRQTAEANQKAFYGTP